jgi:predicted dehydrogenase
MSRLRAGVIGLGVGRQHAAGYTAHPDCEVVALCDISEEALDGVKVEFPKARLSRNAEDLLSDPAIDVVSIASYDNYHYEQIAAALGHNKHVFVEKPMCLYEHEAESLWEMHRAKPQLKLSSNLILRMCPRFRWLKGQIVEGRLGRLFYLDGDYNYGRLHKITEGWRGRIEFYSVVYGGAIHLIDLMTWLTGGKVVEVAAFGNRVAADGSQFKYNDLVACILRFDSGLVAKVTSNFGCVSPHFHNLSVYGTEATFVNRPGAGLLYETRDPQTPPREVTEAYPGVHKGDLIRSFVDSIRGRGPAEVSIEDAFRCMSVCFAVEKAASGAGVVPVRYQ